MNRNQKQEKIMRNMIQEFQDHRFDGNLSQTSLYIILMQHLDEETDEEINRRLKNFKEVN